MPTRVVVPDMESASSAGVVLAAGHWTGEHGDGVLKTPVWPGIVVHEAFEAPQSQLR
jgi:hypothetical protein